MDLTNRKTLPLRRDHDITVVELPEETLVYDARSHKSYCLDRPTGLVWRHCDGRTSLSEMSSILEGKLGKPVNDSTVTVALMELEMARLVEAAPEWGLGRLSRREFLLKAGLVGAAVVIPKIMKIDVAEAAHVASCISVSCSGGGDLCPGGAADLGAPCDPTPGPNQCHCTCKQQGSKVKCRP